jgi:hypothetical protein
MWLASRASFLTRNFATPCFGHEPKAKVVTINLFLMIFNVEKIHAIEFQQLVMVALGDFKIHHIAL